MQSGNYAPIRSIHTTLNTLVSSAHINVATNSPHWSSAASACGHRFRCAGCDDHGDHGSNERDTAGDDQRARESDGCASSDPHRGSARHHCRTGRCAGLVECAQMPEAMPGSYGATFPNADAPRPRPGDPNRCYDGVATLVPSRPGRWRRLPAPPQQGLAVQYERQAFRRGLRRPSSRSRREEQKSGDQRTVAEVLLEVERSEEEHCDHQGSPL